MNTCREFSGIYTIPKTPQQKRVSERIRTLLETVQSILADFQLPHRFLAKTLSIEAYLVNKSPMKAIVARHYLKPRNQRESLMSIWVCNFLTCLKRRS